MSLSTIRNFAVISHIDHGKTTLTDRFLEITGAVSGRFMHDRFLDSNPIEQERGITIKLAPVRLNYTLNAVNHILNLIDTPGHVDFNYEVSRSLAACEGAVLLVDGSQGIQAQTLANAHLALDNHLSIIPVVNKIDLATTDVIQVSRELEETLGFPVSEIIPISAKTGKNVDRLLQAIIDRIPPPQGESDQPLKALVFNSYFDKHRGVIAAVRVVDGSIAPQDSLLLMAQNQVFTPKDIGYFTPQPKPANQLQSGEVGFVATGLKTVSQVKVGDTITHSHIPASAPLPGYSDPKPVVFMELYPVDGNYFLALKEAVDKLKLNDAALKSESVTSPALGQGIRVGFLGMLHSEVVRERLEREFKLEIIATTPTVKHYVTLSSGGTQVITSASDLPEPSQITQLKEPYVALTIFSPLQYLGDILEITQRRRAQLIDQEHFGHRVKLSYHLPLSELISGYYDQLKSVSSGFASLDYKLAGYQTTDAVKLEVLVNHQSIKPLASIVPSNQAISIGRRLVESLKQVLPQEQFEVPIQAAVGGKILARATLKALRKDVTAKLYGGDQTRKDKLLKKQKKGKKRLKQFGQVKIPQEAFLAVLKR